MRILLCVLVLAFASGAAGASDSTIPIPVDRDLGLGDHSGPVVGVPSVGIPQRAAFVVIAAESFVECVGEGPAAVVACDTEINYTACPRGTYEDQNKMCRSYPQCREYHPHNYYHYHSNGQQGYGEWHTAYHCHSYY